LFAGGGRGPVSKQATPPTVCRRASHTRARGSPKWMRARARKESLRGPGTGVRLVEVRRVGQALLWFGLVGCSRENPWFVVKGDGQDATSSTASGGTGSSSGGTSGSDTGPDDTSVGESGTSSAMTSTSTTTTTGPSTTSSTSTSSTTGDMSTGDTSAGDTSTGSGSSTGDIEQENVLYDLYELCPNAAVWSDFNNKTYPCKLAPAPPISVSQTSVLYQAKEINGILVYPAQLLGEYLDGVYELMLMEAVNPRFRAVLLFPVDGGIKDAVVGQIYVESVKSGATVLQAPPIMLTPGEASLIDLDLSDVQAEVAGLLLHLQVTVGGQVATKSRAVWLGPRVVEVP